MEGTDSGSQSENNPSENISEQQLIDQSSDIEKISQIIKGGIGYQITITQRQPNGELRHFRFTNNFLAIDMISSHAKCEVLIVHHMRSI